MFGYYEIAKKNYLEVNMEQFDWVPQFYKG